MLKPETNKQLIPESIKSKTVDACKQVLKDKSKLNRIVTVDEILEAMDKLKDKE